MQLAELCAVREIQGSTTALLGLSVPASRGKSRDGRACRFGTWYSQTEFELQRPFPSSGQQQQPDQLVRLDTRALLETMWVIRCMLHIALQLSQTGDPSDDTGHVLPCNLAQESRPWSLSGSGCSDLNCRCSSVGMFVSVRRTAARHVTSSLFLPCQRRMATRSLRIDLGPRVTGVLQVVSIVVRVWWALAQSLRKFPIWGNFRLISAAVLLQEDSNRARSPSPPPLFRLAMHAKVALAIRN